MSSESSLPPTGQSSARRQTPVDEPKLRPDSSMERHQRRLVQAIRGRAEHILSPNEEIVALTEAGATPFSILDKVLEKLRLVHRDRHQKEAVVGHDLDVSPPAVREFFDSDRDLIEICFDTTGKSGSVAVTVAVD